MPRARAHWPTMERTFGRQRTLLADELREGLAVDELHDQVRQAVVLAVVEEGRDVGVDQPRGVQRLVPEPEGEELLVVGVGPHHLERDLALQDLVARRPDVGHAAGGDAVLEAVPLVQQQVRLGHAHAGDLTGSSLHTWGGRPSCPDERKTLGVQRTSGHASLHHTRR